MTVPFLTRWATASQHQARRNAMLAATVLAQRRVERMEVEEFLASLSDPVTPHSAQQSDEPVSAHG